ncbi:hypothetical protein D3C80_1570740 [compost metagenome]
MGLVIFRVGADGAFQQTQLEQGVREAVGRVGRLSGTALHLSQIRAAGKCIQLTQRIMHHRIHRSFSRNHSQTGCYSFLQQTAAHVIGNQVQIVMCVIAHQQLQSCQSLFSSGCITKCGKCQGLLIIGAEVSNIESCCLLCKSQCLLIPAKLAQHSRFQITGLVVA